MTNILYGVHGTGHGHAIRALTIASYFPQHNFLFLSDEDGYDILWPDQTAHRLPSYTSPVVNHKIHVGKMMLSWFNAHVSGRSDRKEIIRLVDAFQPDVAITDFESNTPRISRKLGIPCLSIDNQHIARFGCPALPVTKAISLAMLRLAMFIQFQSVNSHMVISFFNTGLQSKNGIRIFPPILRKEVLARLPSVGEHVLAYHGYSTTEAFHKFLLTIKHPVLCYGNDENKTIGNVTYRKDSTDQFLDDLASCRYVLSSAGHTLLSEALFYGKPVMAFPVRNAFEQFLNGHYIEKSGYGVVNDAFQPSVNILTAFEQNQEMYTQRIRKGSFNGNEMILSALSHYFKTSNFIVDPEETS